MMEWEEHLREMAQTADEHPEYKMLAWFTARDAVAEIDRLRAEIARLKAEIAELKAADGLYTDAETGPEYSFAHQKFQEAVKELFKELERGNDDRN